MSSSELSPDKPFDPLSVQVGGDHYKMRGIQPIEFIQANDLGFEEGSIVKYVTRWRDKDGIKDLNKVIHYAQFLIAKALKEGHNPDGGPAPKNK